MKSSYNEEFLNTLGVKTHKPNSAAAKICFGSGIAFLIMAVIFALLLRFNVDDISKTVRFEEGSWVRVDIDTTPCNVDVSIGNDTYSLSYIETQSGSTVAVLTSSNESKKGFIAKVVSRNSVTGESITKHELDEDIVFASVVTENTHPLVVVMFLVAIIGCIQTLIGYRSIQAVKKYNENNKTSWMLLEK